ncbi:hypothetical protein [Bathymodiolus platifrons methanotrophic gill symbiont]|uniref:hypothetical protein n=1 Tax=Bathymodiolus platifrons methanotrophic gill symbiont TaxID=113268 RepID=UPI000B40910B|nr:hypothetical protein [Bathymodiolus platifrons methanotrophic gill symbiont]
MRQNLKELVLLEDDLKNYLPKANHVEKFDFKIENDQLTNSSNKVLGGIELQRINEDGSIGWILRVSESKKGIYQTVI